MKKPDRSYAPWTDDELANLNRFQTLGFMHEFTCCSPEEIPECQRRTKQNGGMLTATTDGWVCPCGKYKQDWCYPYMLDVKKMVDEFNKTPFGKIKPITLTEL